MRKVFARGGGTTVDGDVGDGQNTGAERIVSEMSTSIWAEEEQGSLVV